MPKKIVDIGHLARLSNLTLTPKESKTISSQFSETIRAIDKLKSLSTKNTKPTHHTTGLTNITREDKVDSKRVLSQQQALSQTKASHRGYFVAKGVLDEN